MFKIGLLISVVLVASRVGRADSENTEQTSNGESQFTPIDPNPLSKYSSNDDTKEQEPESRFVSRSSVGLINRFPIQFKPNSGSERSSFDSCSSPSGEFGICSSNSVCSQSGGRQSGSCLLGEVCCLNEITTCGGVLTLNNTYWQSPTAPVTSPSTCAITVKLNTQLAEQKKPICQVRLDFVSFSVAQPDSDGICTDAFRVAGADNNVPTICGNNNGQHMYLTVPPSDVNPIDLQLMFSFGSTGFSRSWKIKVSMLPCQATYLAPTGCLQFYSSASGRITSFNWEDTNSAVRQLANQHYAICFRSEILISQAASKICFTVCAGKTYAFSITGDADVAASSFLSSSGTNVVDGDGTPTATCMYDYLLIPDARDMSSSAGLAADRYCGLNLNPIPLASGNKLFGKGGSNNSITVCTRNYPFKIYYHTDNTEGPISAPNIPAAEDALNVGFCLDFQENF